MKTMHEQYGDESDHEVCEKCGYCKDCKDCRCMKNKVTKCITSIFLFIFCLIFFLNPNSTPTTFFAGFVGCIVTIIFFIVNLVQAIKIKRSK